MRQATKTSMKEINKCMSITMSSLIVGKIAQKRECDSKHLCFSKQEPQIVVWKRSSCRREKFQILQVVTRSCNHERITDFVMPLPNAPRNSLSLMNDAMCVYSDILHPCNKDINAVGIHAQFFSDASNNQSLRCSARAFVMHIDECTLKCGR